MYTTRWCGYCTAAERLLEARSIPYERVDVSGDRATRRWLVEATGGRTTVPQIFIGGGSIGGYTELRELDRSGELARLLAADGVVVSS
jgi:glutaredoxin 3